jgi:hypothetical protein
MCGFAAHTQNSVFLLFWIRFYFAGVILGQRVSLGRLVMVGTGVRVEVGVRVGKGGIGVGVGVGGLPVMLKSPDFFHSVPTKKITW